MSAAAGNSKQVTKQPAAWSLSSFLYNNISRLLWLTGLVGGIYLLGKYAQSKLREYTDKMAIERTAKEKCVPSLIVVHLAGVDAMPCH